MKKALFTFMALLFVIATAVHAQTKKTIVPKLKGPEPEALDCKTLRTGTFKSIIQGKTTIMERTATTETDYLDGNVVSAIYAVKWLNDCTYTLTPTEQTIKLHPEIKKGTIFTVEIVLKNTNSYTTIVSANYTKAKNNVEVYKVK
jgi:hypothetical protein